ncbi:MAG TPA: hypothetical protein VMX17_15710 [Candidatus Glassbacteria bacterium]|nr:hypothetical protein [Candidatus Glassbacteria bacterium]
MTTRRKLKKRMGWHLLPEDGKLRDGRIPHINKWLSFKIRGIKFIAADTVKKIWRKPYDYEKPILCEEGMHATYNINNAIIYGYKFGGLLLNEKQKLCRVIVDKINTSEYDGYKFVGERRKIIWSITLTKDDLDTLWNMSISGALKYVNKLRKKQAKDKK